MKCLLDMDGVIADFVGGACRTHRIEYPYNRDARRPEAKNNWDIVSLFGMKPDDFWKPLEEEFWASLEFTEEAHQILELVEKYFGAENVCLLTTPSLNLGSIPGKMRWLETKLPRYARRYLCGPRKEFCAHSQATLVDDNDGNIDGFKKNGGNGILLPRPWNSLHSHENRTIEILEDSLEKLFTSAPV